jgi:hypothetical protein
MNIILPANDNFPSRLRLLSHSVNIVYGFVCCLAGLIIGFFHLLLEALSKGMNFCTDR